MAKGELSEYLYKIVVLGEIAVGKTSLRRKFMGQGFERTHIATLGADFSHKVIELEFGLASIQVWDIAGQEVFKLIRSKFLRGTKGAILVYDCTRKESLPKLQQWINDLWSINKTKNIPLLLVGNKIDLVDQKVVDIEMAKNFCKELKKQNKIPFIEVLETSAKTGKNVELGFQKLTYSIYKVFNENNK